MSKEIKIGELRFPEHFFAIPLDHRVPEFRTDPVSALNRLYEDKNKKLQTFEKKTIVVQKSSFFQGLPIADKISLIKRLQLEGFKVYLCCGDAVSPNELHKVPDNLQNIYQYLSNLSNFDAAKDYEILAKKGIAADKVLVFDEKETRSAEEAFSLQGNHSWERCQYNFSAQEIKDILVAEKDQAQKKNLLLFFLKNHHNKAELAALVKDSALQFDAKELTVFLKACADLKDEGIKKAIHLEIIKKLHLQNPPQNMDLESDLRDAIRYLAQKERQVLVERAVSLQGFRWLSNTFIAAQYTIVGKGSEPNRLIHSDALISLARKGAESPEDLLMKMYVAKDFDRDLVAELQRMPQQDYKTRLYILILNPYNKVLPQKSAAIQEPKDAKELFHIIKLAGSSNVEKVEKLLDELKDSKLFKSIENRIEFLELLSNGPSLGAGYDVAFVNKYFDNIFCEIDLKEITAEQLLRVIKVAPQGSKTLLRKINDSFVNLTAANISEKNLEVLFECYQYLSKEDQDLLRERSIFKVVAQKISIDDTLKYIKLLPELKDEWLKRCDNAPSVENPKFKGLVFNFREIPPATQIGGVRDQRVAAAINDIVNFIKGQPQQAILAAKYVPEFDIQFLDHEFIDRFKKEDLKPLLEVFSSLKQELRMDIIASENFSQIFGSLSRQELQEAIKTLPVGALVLFSELKKVDFFARDKELLCEYLAKVDDHVRIDLVSDLFAPEAKIFSKGVGAKFKSEFKLLDAPSFSKFIAAAPNCAAIFIDNFDFTKIAEAQKAAFINSALAAIPEQFKEKFCANFYSAGDGYKNFINAANIDLLPIGLRKRIVEEKFHDLKKTDWGKKLISSLGEASLSVSAQEDKKISRLSFNFRDKKSVEDALTRTSLESKFRIENSVANINRDVSVIKIAGENAALEIFSANLGQFKPFLPSLKCIDISEIVDQTLAQKIEQQAAALGLEVIRSQAAMAKPKLPPKPQYKLTPAAQMAENLFQNAVRPKVVASAPEFTASILSDHQNADKKTILVETKDIEGHANAIIAEAVKKGRPVFYVDSPDKVNFDRPTFLINKQGDKYVAAIDKQGALGRFIDNTKGQDPLIIINWQAFDKNQRLALNSMLDLNPEIKGKKLDPTTQVLGFCNYIAPDYSFISRNKTLIKSEANFVANDEKIKGGKVKEIDFAGSDDWREKFFGNMGEEGGKSILRYHSSLVRDALFIDDEDDHDQIFSYKFVNLSEKAAKELRYEINQARAFGYFEHHGLKMPIPKSFNVEFSDQKYSFASLRPIKIAHTHNAQPQSKSRNEINDKSFEQVLYEMEREEWRRIDDLFVSSQLNREQWYRLIASINKSKLERGGDFKIFLPANIKAPDEINKTNDLDDAEGMFIDAVQLPNIIVTNQKRYDVVDLANRVGGVGRVGWKGENADWKNKDIVIDVGDLSKGDFGDLTEFALEDGKISQKRIKNRILEFLAETKEGGDHWRPSLTFRGKFSPELLKMLHPVLMGIRPYNTAQIFIVIEDDSVTSETSVYKPLEWLPRKFYKVDYKQQNVAAEVIKKDEKAYIATEKDANKFVEKRAKVLTDLIESEDGHNLVQMIGGTGVGKSSLMKSLEEKGKSYSKKVFRELTSFEDWINDKSPQTKILFIDESNIEQQNFHLFENLKQKFAPGEKRKIYYKGKLHEVDQYHKVVFARNPKEYGGGRVDQGLFDDNSVPEFHLSDFPECYIYQKILKEAIFDKLHKTQQQLISDFQKFAQPLIEEYSRENASEDKSRHRTVRNLQEKVLKSLVLKIEGLQEDRDLGIKGKNFTSTTATKKIEQDLNLSIKIRNKQRIGAGQAGYVPSDGIGHNGFLMQGGSGTGKSEMIAALLAKNNIQKLGEGNPADQKYVKIEAILSFEQKKQKILEAFHAGNIVWIDEINSCIEDGLEKVINATLTGVDLDGKPAAKKGFMLISSINEISLEGRAEISEALRNRCNYHSVPDLSSYPVPDLVKIINCWKDFAAVDGHISKINAESAAQIFHDVLQNPDNSHFNLRMFRDLLDSGEWSKVQNQWQSEQDGLDRKAQPLQDQPHLPAPPKPQPQLEPEVVVDGNQLLQQTKDRLEELKNRFETECLFNKDDPRNRAKQFAIPRDQVGEGWYKFGLNRHGNAQIVRYNYSPDKKSATEYLLEVDDNGVVKLKESKCGIEGSNLKRLSETTVDPTQVFKILETYFKGQFLASDAQLIDQQINIIKMENVKLQEQLAAAKAKEAADLAAPKPAAPKPAAPRPKPEALNQQILSAAKPIGIGAAKLAEYQKSVRPVVNREVFDLMKEHIMLTMQHGTDVEKACYSEQIFGGIAPADTKLSDIKDQHVENLIWRLINKRPVVFFTGSDTNLLRDGSQAGPNAFTQLHNIDGPQHFSLANYISYDEMKLAAFLHASSKTHFMNDGRRGNRGADERADPEVIKEGVVVGSVGARFERPYLMEWQDMMVTAQDSYSTHLEDGTANHDPKRQVYRAAQKSMWAKFYGIENEDLKTKAGTPHKHPTLAEAKADVTGRFVDTGNGQYLDTHVFKKMLKLRLAAVLQEANDRGQEADKKAYVHLAGLGLGVWQKSDKQNEIFYDVVVDLLKEMKLPHVEDVDLSWISGNESRHPIGKIEAINGKNLHNTNNDPSIMDRPGNHKKGKLLVQDFAWDGNSFGGNEYWFKMYGASGDPAAACSAPIVARGFNETLNPELTNAKVHIVDGNVAAKAVEAVDERLARQMKERLVNLKQRLERECLFDARSFLIEERSKTVFVVGGKKYEFGLNRFGNAYVSYFSDKSKSPVTEYLLEINKEGRAVLVEKKLVTKDGKLHEQSRSDVANVPQILADYFDSQIFANESQILNAKIEEVRQAKLNDKYLKQLQELAEKHKDKKNPGQQIILYTLAFDGNNYEVGFNHHGGLYIEKIMPLDLGGQIDERNRHSHVLILSDDGKKVLLKSRREDSQSSKDVSMKARGALQSSTAEERDIADIKFSSINMQLVLDVIEASAPSIVSLSTTSLSAPATPTAKATTAAAAIEPVLDLEPRGFVPTSPAAEVNIDLVKGSAGFGFSFAGGIESGDAVGNQPFIKGIVPGGVFANALSAAGHNAADFVGREIIAVNGQLLKDMKHAEIVSFIKGQQAIKITLSVKKRELLLEEPIAKPAATSVVADVNLRDANGATPLVIAIEKYINDDDQGARKIYGSMIDAIINDQYITSENVAEALGVLNDSQRQWNDKTSLANAQSALERWQNNKKLSDGKVSELYAKLKALHGDDVFKLRDVDDGPAPIGSEVWITELDIKGAYSFIEGDKGGNVRLVRKVRDGVSGELKFQHVPNPSQKLLGAIEEEIRSRAQVAKDFLTVDPNPFAEPLDLFFKKEIILDDGTKLIAEATTDDNLQIKKITEDGVEILREDSNEYLRALSLFIGATHTHTLSAALDETDVDLIALDLDTAMVDSAATPLHETAPLDETNFQTQTLFLRMFGRGRPGGAPYKTPDDLITTVGRLGRVPHYAEPDLSGAAHDTPIKLGTIPFPSLDEPSTQTPGGPKNLGARVADSTAIVETLARTARGKEARQKKNEMIATNIQDNKTLLKADSLIVADGHDLDPYNSLEALEVKIGSEGGIGNSRVLKDITEATTAGNFNLADYGRLGIVSKAKKMGQRKSLDQDQYEVAKKNTFISNNIFDQYTEFAAVDFTGVNFEKIIRPNFRNCSFDKTCKFPEDSTKWIAKESFSDCTIDIKSFDGNKNKDAIVAKLKKTFGDNCINGDVCTIEKREIAPATPSTTLKPTTQFKLAEKTIVASI